MSRWAFFVDRRPWDGGTRLFITTREHRGQPAYVLPFTAQSIEPGAVYDVPTLTETRVDTQDANGDVTGFLQAAMDCAWEMGLRPTGFADHTNELMAVRHHLEDMRLLEKVRKE